ncbi:MAG TPA: hypothetical protein VMW24_26530 [Sedimentisphaerales bacterium]|nr:hypothetical protein [Sedimentisphaerales bacterium]
MAIDTKQRRYSAMLIGLPWRGALPKSDGIIDAADRLMLLNLYTGNVGDLVGDVLVATGGMEPGGQLAGGAAPGGVLTGGMAPGGTLTSDTKGGG